MPPLSPLSLNPPNLPAPPLPHLDFHRPTTTSTTAPSSFDFAFDNGPDPEPETTHLLPPPTPKRHTVRVQGQLVLVKSVSVNNLSPAPSPSSPGLGAGEGERPVSGMPPLSRVVETALGGGGGGVRGRRRMSFTAFGQQGDGTGEGLGIGGVVDETEEERRARKGRDRQLRGYGIGGRGNIREFFLPLCLFRGWLCGSGADIMGDRSPNRGGAVWGKEGRGTGFGADDADRRDVSEEGVEFEGEVGVGGAASEEGLRGGLGIGDIWGGGGEVMAFLVSTAYHPAALAMHILIIRGFKI